MRVLLSTLFRIFLGSSRSLTNSIGLHVIAATAEMRMSAKIDTRINSISVSDIASASWVTSRDSRRQQKIKIQMPKMGHFSRMLVFLSIACLNLLTWSGWEIGNVVLSFLPNHSNKNSRYRLISERRKNWAFLVTNTASAFLARTQ